jgi:hypothetical protein
MQSLRSREGVDDFHYRRRHLAKLDQANVDGWHELRYQDEEAELLDAIERMLKIIRETRRREVLQGSGRQFD